MKHLIALALVALPAVAFAQSSSKQVQREAIGHLRAGRVEQAVTLLQQHLKSASDDLGVRVLLGKVFAWDGRPDEAVRCWKAGITAEAKPLELYLAVGGIRLQQADDGPNITRKRGMMRATPSKDKAADAAWKTARAKDAVAIFEAGLAAHPGQPKLVDGLSRAYLAAGDEAGAVAFLEKQAKSSKNPALSLRLAKLLEGKPEEAVVWYRRALELDPRSGEAYRGIAAYHRAKGETKEAEAAEQKAAFFGWLPPLFTHVPFTAERFQQVQLLGARGDTKAQLELVDKLGASKDAADLELMAAFVYHHPHNQVEDRAFELFGKRADAAPILTTLFRRGQSQCTKRGAAHALAACKAPGALDLLVRALPGDLRGAWNMDIAGALALLGDPRAVPALVRFLAPTRREPKQRRFNPFVNRLYARQRAALALGAFDTEEARTALATGAKNPDLALECLAAQYRQAPTPEHLAALRTAGLAKPGGTYLIVRYLEQHADAAGKKLAAELEAAAKAKRKARRKGR